MKRTGLFDKTADEATKRVAGAAIDDIARTIAAMIIKPPLSLSTIQAPVSARFQIVILAIAWLVSGCVTNLSRPSAPNATLQSYKSFYIVQSDTDNRGISRIIESELHALGKAAKSGPRTLVPSNVDAVITYYEDWKWDMTWYLLNLLIQIRDPKTNVLVTSAASYRTSLARTQPELMTREVLEAIFK